MTFSRHTVNDVKLNPQAATRRCMTQTPEGRDVGRPATGKTPVRSVRLPDPLWDAVRQVAEAKGWTASDVVAAALHRYITAELASEGGAAGQPTPPVGSP